MTLLALLFFSWHTAKHVIRDPAPVAADFNEQDYATLVAHPFPFKKFPEAFLCLVGVSRHYTLDEETYPRFLYKNREEMDIFAFIHTSDPTKVKIIKRERNKGEPLLLETTIGCTIPLLPVAPDRAKSELDASVELIFNGGGSGIQTKQGDSIGGGKDADIQLVIEVADTVVEDVAPVQLKRQGKRKSVIVDAGGASHPPKKLKDDHGTPSGTSVSGKSKSALKRLLAEAALNAKSRDHTDSAARLKLHAIGTPPRFVISSDSSHHYAGGTDPATGVFSNLTGSDFLVGAIRTVVDPDTDLQKVYVPQWSVTNGLVLMTLFIEFNVEAARQMSLGAKVRMRAEYNVKEKRRLKSVAERQVKLLKVREEEIENLKAQLLLREAKAAEVIRLCAQASNFEAVKKSLQDETNALKERNSILEKEQNVLDVKVTELEASTVGKERELTDLNALITYVKSQNDIRVNRVHKLEISSFGLQEKVTVYENYMDQLEKFQYDQMKVVNDKFDKLYADFVETALHLEEKFYPHLFTTVFDRRWLLTHAMDLAIVKCLNTPKYISTLGVAIGKAIEKGMQDGLSTGIIHGKEGRALTDVAAHNLFTEDVSVETMMNILHLEGPLAEKLGLNELQPNTDQPMVPIHRSPNKVVLGATALSLTLDVSSFRVWKIRENIVNQRSALRDVFVPLVEPFSAAVLTGMEGTSDTVPATANSNTTLSTTFASASSIDHISVDDYEVVVLSKIFCLGQMWPLCCDLFAFVILYRPSHLGPSFLVSSAQLASLLWYTRCIKVNGVTDDALRLYLFPHSLTHHATAWFDRLPMISINTFEQMAKMFLGKYFPPSMVTKLRNEITNFRQRPDESLFEAWERYKLSIDRCLNHNMLPVTQIDTFYNGLTLRYRDTINVAAGGTVMKRRPEECYDLIKNITAHQNDWDTSVQWRESSTSITSSSDPEIVALNAEMAEINKNLMKVLQINQQVKAIAHNCETCGGPHFYNDCPATVGQTQNVYAAGAYNQGGNSYQPQVENQIPNSEPVVASVAEPVEAPISALKPNLKTSIPYPSRLHDQKLRDKANDQKEKFFQIFKDLDFNISFADALIPMPKFGSSIKNLLTNIEKLFELARHPLNEHCSANKLSLPELSPTCMTLELADRSISRPVGVAEDVYVKVGTFHFLADFVVVDFDADPRVPLILERSFLKTGRALIDVYKGELTLRVGKEAITFNLDKTLRYSANYDAINPTPSTEPIVSNSSHTLTPFGDSDFILEETDAFLAIDDDLISPKINDCYYDSEGDILLLEEFLNDDPSLPPLPPFGTPRAIISDCGTYFCNDQFAKVMLKYGVTHRLATAYHPQTSRQVKVSNRGFKRILKRTVGENRASDKLDDALWAFRIAFKTPIGCTSYKFVYGKACHLPIELEHKAYLALKHCNFDLLTAGDHRKVQLNELYELRDQAYENSLIYKEKTKRIHDSKIKDRVFNVGDRVLLFNSRLKIFLGKLKTRWSGPFTITQVFPYDTVKLSQTDGSNFKVNGHKLKHYFGEDIPKMVVPDLQTFPKDQ
nr:reverse transcriptase domain-containing protein [Tanacetum cinerariifolium]